MTPSFTGVVASYQIEHMTRKNTANKNLLQMKAILEDLGIVFWLEGGTLLGAYRDNDFCADDEDDVDLSTWYNYAYLIPEIIRRAEKKGFTLHNLYRDHRRPEFAPQLAFKKDKLKIDLIFYEKQKDKAVGFVFKKHTKGFEGIPRVVPVQYFELLDVITFYKNEYNCPYDIEGYLEYLYGDWKTPRHRSTYSCYNSDDLKALQPEYAVFG
jgi:phosphorylcholine metabolism protein LicD